MLYVKLFDIQHYIFTEVKNKEVNTEITLIGSELRCLNHLIRRYFDRYSHVKQIDKITGTNGWIIGYLAENADKDIFQRDLEKHFSITRSTASRVLSLMEEKGLITRSGVPGDLRLKKLGLTDRAVELSLLMREDHIKMENQLIKGFSDEELNTLSGYIQRMKENISVASD